MKMSDHLCGFEHSLKGGNEWQVTAEHWLIIQLHQGVGYVRTANSAEELTVGGVLLIPLRSEVRILASTLEHMVLRGISLRMGALTGIVTASERFCLEGEAASQCAPCRILPEDHPFARRFRETWRPQGEMTVLHRVRMLGGFVEYIAPLLRSVGAGDTGETPSLRERLKAVLNEVPESELMQMSLARLAGRLGCCERHASRTFSELFDCSFRQYVSRIRLDLACRLLVEGQGKIIDVAYESGHNSLATFNQMFKKRFGKTPSEWRAANERRRVPGRDPLNGRPIRRLSGPLTRVAAGIALTAALLLPAVNSSQRICKEPTSTRDDRTVTARRPGVSVPPDLPQRHVDVTRPWSAGRAET